MSSVSLWSSWRARWVDARRSLSERRVARRDARLARQGEQRQLRDEHRRLRAREKQLQRESKVSFQRRRAVAQVNNLYGPRMAALRQQRREALTVGNQEKVEQCSRDLAQLEQRRFADLTSAEQEAVERAQQAHRDLLLFRLDVEESAPAGGPSWGTWLVWILATVSVSLAGVYFAAAAFLGAVPPFIPTVGTSMNPTVYQGDLAVVRSVDPATIEVGDAIAFRTTELTQARYGTPEVVLHRVVDVSEGAQGRVFTTQGDNNPDPDVYRTPQVNVIGEMVAVVPKAGYALLLIQGPSGRILLGVAILLVVTYWVLGVVDRSSQRSQARDELMRRLMERLPPS